MKETYWTYLIIILGLLVITIMILIQDLSSTNEEDYYLTREVMEAAMIDSIDYGLYMETEDIRIIESKFVENFTRRFTETSTFGQGNYSIYYYQISEYPAKVSLRIVDSTNSYNIYNTYSVDIDATQINVVNELSAILDGYK